jgi:acetyl esterase
MDAHDTTVLPLDGRWQDPPCVLPPTVDLRRDIIFARPAGHDLLLDLFLPTQRRAPAPGMVFLHGGGWRAGSRQQFWRQAIHLATLGIVGICSGYRFAPEFVFPAQLEDAQAAVRWLREQADELGVDAQRIGAAGGSAGGHLAALLGTCEAVVGGVPSRVQAVIAFNGVFDLTSLRTAGGSSAVEGLLGPSRRLAAEASPLVQAAAGAAPTLLLHGTADTTVPFAQAEAYQRRLRELGNRAELAAADGAAHGYFNRPPYYQATLTRMEQFVCDVLGTDAAAGRSWP